MKHAISAALVAARLVSSKHMIRSGFCSQIAGGKNVLG